jgi:pre-mRNA cleavage complex 2 protein Pcf11
LVVIPFSSAALYQDKIKINTLSMVAEDHAGSTKNATLIYNIIRQPLISNSIHGDRKLPLVYLIDSILKNVKGKFVPIIEDDVMNWMPVVYEMLQDDKRLKLKKVWNLWKDANVFSPETWKAIGQCFSGNGMDGMTDDTIDKATLEQAGITFGVSCEHKRMVFSTNSFASMITTQYHSILSLLLFLFQFTE